jgi:hypothetical protein
VKRKLNGIERSLYLPRSRHTYFTHEPDERITGMGMYPVDRLYPLSPFLLSSKDKGQRSKQYESGSQGMNDRPSPYDKGIGI